jgi:hypothetical protein
VNHSIRPLPSNPEPLTEKQALRAQMSSLWEIGRRQDEDPETKAWVLRKHAELAEQMRRLPPATQGKIIPFPVRSRRSGWVIR